MNTLQKRAFPLWDKGVAEVMQRMAEPNECERGAAEWKSQSEELLFKKVAKEGSQSEREELSAFRKKGRYGVPSWNTSDAAAVLIGWLSERRGLMLLYLLILFEKERKRKKYIIKEIQTQKTNKKMTPEQRVQISELELFFSFFLFWTEMCVFVFDS